MNWISVKDRLPDPYIPVLIFNKNWARSPQVGVYHDHLGFLLWSDLSKLPKEYSFTHWMPLPEPPEEEPCNCCCCKNK